MIRRVSLVALVAMALAVSPALVTADTNTFLQQISSDSHAVIIVSNWQSFGAKVGRVAQQLGVGDMIPPDGLTPLLEMQSGLKLTQLDPQGTGGIVLPKLSADQDEPPAVVVIPVKDYAQFLTDNKGGMQDGQATITSQKNKVMFIKQAGSYACMSENAELLAAVGTPAKPLVLSADQKKLLGETDLFVHVNLPGVAPVLQAIAQKQLGAVEGGDVLVGMLNSLSKEGESLDLGGLIADDGFEVRGLLTAKADSETAKAFSAMKGGNAVSVRNVPIDGYLFAFGIQDVMGLANIDPQGTDSLTKLLGEALGDAEGAALMKQHAQNLMKLATNASAVLSATMAEGGRPSLPISIAKVVEVSDSAKALAEVRGYLKQFARMLNVKVKAMAPQNPDANEEAALPPAAVYTEGAGEIGGVKVDTLTLNFGALGADGAAVAAVVQMATGEQMLTIRVGVQDNLLIATLGGGQQTFTRTLTAIKNKESLAADAGVKKVAGHLIPQRNVEIFVAADRLAELAGGIAAMFAGRPLPAFPKVNEPIAVSIGFANQSAEGRIYVPMNLVLAGQKWINAVDAAKAQENNAEPAPAPGEPEF